MAPLGYGQSSSLFSSSSTHSLISDRPVSSPASQSQPPPIRRTPRMGPAKSSAADAQPAPPQKRASSFAGFFSKILPSNRPEQGGTRRTIDRTSNINDDLVISPNELTDWNLAKEKKPAYPASIFPDDSSHRRVWSWSPQKGDSKFVENLPRDRSRGREQDLNALDREPLPPLKSESQTGAEVHELLQSKEENRRNRRSLKESGDWLGVQGADPYSGQFPVLTPTDTLSSETTPASTRDKLVGLARKKKAARQEYEQARLLEEQEKEKARLDKEKAKLNKIERVKEELRRQHQFAKWSQHKRQWSSAAEPNLSPIAQSLDSVALGSSETSSLLFPELLTDSFSSDAEGNPSTVLNFSRPTRPPVSMKNLPGQIERLSCDDAQSQGRRNIDVSTDTIIHNLPDSSEHISLSRPATQPSKTHPEAGQPGIGRTKSEKHFLWRRRREMDPGKSDIARHGGIVMSMAAQNRTSNLVEYIQRDHFAGLAIPDYRLHLLSLEPMNTIDNQPTPPENSPLTSPNTSSLGGMCSNRIALSSTTNLVGPQVDGTSSQNTKIATVTPSRSKLKEMMKRSSIRRKLVPSLLTSAHTKDVGRHHVLPPAFDELQGRTANNLPIDASGRPSQHSQRDLQGRINSEGASRRLPHRDSHIKRAQRESVSIPIITTTGSVPDWQNQQVLVQPGWNAQPSKMDGNVGTTNSPASPVPSDQHEPCVALDLIPEKRRTHSPPIAPQNDSLNIELIQETPVTGIISLQHAMQERRQLTRVSTPTTPGLCQLVQQNIEANQAGATGDRDTVAKTEKDKTQKTIYGEANGISQQGEAREASRESRSPSTTGVQILVSQESPRRVSCEEQKESRVGEAARIAPLRSRAREVVRGRSADSKTGHNRSQSPSPAKKQALNGERVESKHSLQRRRSGKKRHSGEDAGTALLSKPEQLDGNRATHQAQHRKGATEAQVAVDMSAPITTVAQFCKTVYILFLGLACAWWIMVQPAFDQRSDLWRRKHKKESTWRDVAVFMSAGASCLAGALCSWYVLGLFR